mgnify:CR=1 FL=1
MHRSRAHRHHADRHAAVEIGAFALENGVRLDRKENVEVARRRAVRARFAAAAEADSGAVVDPWRNLDVERLDPVHPALAAAFAAGLFDHLPAAVAVRTGPLDHEQPLLRPHFAEALAQVTAAT